MRAWILAATVLVCAPPAFGGPLPAPAPGVATQTVPGLVASGAAGRVTLGAVPTVLTPLDSATFGGPTIAANAQSDPSSTETTSGSPSLGITAAYVYAAGTVSVTTNGTAQAVITLPSGVTLPSYLLGNVAGNGIKAVSLATGTTWSNNPIVTAITGTGPYTVTLNPAPSSSGTFTSGLAFLPSTGGSVFGSYSNSSTPFTASQDNAENTMELNFCSTSGNLLTCPAGAFNATYLYSDTTAGDGSSIQITIHDPTGTNADFTTTVLSATSSVATLAAAPPYTLSNANAVQLSFGPMVFTPAMVGQTCDIGNIGAAGAELIAAISGYTDPFHVTLASNAGVTRHQTPNELRCGTDDSAALISLFSYAVNSGYSEVTFPQGVKPFWVTPSAAAVANVLLCNDGSVNGGRIVYPIGSQFLRNAARCTPPFARQAIPVTLNRNENYRQAVSKALAGGPVVVDATGDSMCSPSSNHLAFFGSLSKVIEESYKTANAGSPLGFPGITVNNRCIGATTMSELDPAGPVIGAASGVPPTNLTSISQWYTNQGSQWISYIKADCPDVLTIRFSNDLVNLNVSAWWNVIAYTQTAAWRTTCGSNPDIIINSAAFNPQGNTSNASYAQQENMLFISRWEASMVESGDYYNPQSNTWGTLASGGHIGLLDTGRTDILYQTGVDIERGPLRRADEVEGMGANYTTGAIATPPFQWPVPVMGWELGFQTKSVAGSASTFWSNLGGYLIMGIGNGAYGTPVGIGGQTSTMLTGYPGNELVEGTNGTDYTVGGYLYNFTSSGTCSITSGQTSLVCSASLANQGHSYGQISIPGAGSAACPWMIAASTNCLNTTIGKPGVSTNPVSADGKTLTLSDPATATLSSAAVTVAIYHSFYPITDTGIPVVLATNGSYLTNLTFAGVLGTHGYVLTTNGVLTTGQPAFDGNVETFGGHYQPLITSAQTGVGSALFSFYLDSNTQRSEATQFTGTQPLLPPMETGYEAFGSCQQGGQNGTGPYGGACVAHASHLSIKAYEDTYNANSAQMEFSAPSFASAPRIVTSGATQAVQLSDSELDFNYGAATAVAVSMPAQPMLRHRYAFADIGGTAAGGTAFTIAAPSGGTINGAASVTLNTAHQSLSVSCSTPTVCSTVQ
jgi:hypothetical protein